MRNIIGAIQQFLIFSQGTQAQHLTVCVLDGCDAPIGQRGKSTVQSQPVCTVHVTTVGKT